MIYEHLYNHSNDRDKFEVLTNVFFKDGIDGILFVLRSVRKKKLEMQSCHNDVRAMTPCFYVSNEGATLGLSRAICKKSVAYVIVEIVRAKERSSKRPETEKMVPGRSRMRVSGERRI